MPRRRRLAALGPVPAPAINPALDRATKPGLAAEAELAVVAGPALALATLPVLAAAINPVEVGTNSQFGGKYLARQPRSPGPGSGACFAHGSRVARLAVGGTSITNVEGVDHGSLQAWMTVQ